MSDPVSLSELATAIPGASVSGDAEIHSITHDSRDARPGSLFVAIRGMEVDGHDYARAAIAAGTSALAVEHPMALDIPQIVVTDTRAALAQLAAVVYRHPSREIDVVGVTGTNGKTTVTHILESVATTAGIPAGIVGTVGAHIGDRSIAVARTTPEASDLQALLRQMADEGIRLAALEISSHAMELHRVDAVAFRAVAFTNLSQDHLDFHGTMDRYYQAKADLFAPDRARAAIINIDDPAGRQLAASTSLRTITVTVQGRPADMTARIVAADLAGTDFDVLAPSWQRRMRIRIAGSFNVANALIAVALADELGIGADDIAAGVASLDAVPGRFELIDEGQDFGVVVDYAHTPDAIATIVDVARDLVPGRVIVVVGAAGDRDREKRPLMGRATAQADLAVITSDNPRSENPEALVDAVADGAEVAGGSVVRCADRRAALREALEMAASGDIVLILGKGHEVGQETAGKIVPFDDREVARSHLSEILAAKGGAA